MSEQFAFDFAYAYGEPEASAVMRSQLEDFQVVEHMGFEPSGEGEHCWLLVRKRDANTEWVARQLARAASVTSREIGYSGLKDKQAVTTQWFSVHLPGKADPDWSQLGEDAIEILTVSRHHSKLRRGTHKTNGFVITLRDVDGDQAWIEQRLEQIRLLGVPNYFGEQRFGHQGNNLKYALAMLQGEMKVKDRHKRSLYLSAARSYLFNLILSARVSEASWNRILQGDVAMLNGTNSFFTVDELDEACEQRCQEMDIHPSAPLWGKGVSKSQGHPLEIEMDSLSKYESLARGLEKSDLKQMRRPLRLLVDGLQWRWSSSQILTLEFVLPSGCFATSFLREVVDY